MKYISRLLLPVESRTFRGERWVRISLRTGHLVGTAGLGGGFLYQAPTEAWMPYLILTMATGWVSVALELWCTALWLIQVRGLAVFAKLIVLAGMHFFPSHAVHGLIAVVVISGLISHAPGDVRYYSIFHRRRIESL